MLGEGHPLRPPFLPHYRPQLLTLLGRWHSYRHEPPKNWRNKVRPSSPRHPIMSSPLLRPPPKLIPLPIFTQPRHFHNGHHLLLWRHPRRRLPHHHRRLHRQPRHRQADPRLRLHLVLPLGLRRRHAGRRRHRELPPRHVRDDERRAGAHDGGGGEPVPGAVLREQGSAIVSFLPALSPARCGKRGEQAEVEMVTI